MFTLHETDSWHVILHVFGVLADSLFSHLIYEEPICDFSLESSLDIYSFCQALLDLLLYIQYSSNMTITIYISRPVLRKCWEPHMLTLPSPGFLISRMNTGLEKLRSFRVCCSSEQRTEWKKELQVANDKADMVGRHWHMNRIDFLNSQFINVNTVCFFSKLQPWKCKFFLSPLIPYVHQWCYEWNR